MLEEIDGVAVGSGRQLEEILLINARTDILAIVEAERAARKIPGCTALSLRGGDRLHPSIVLAQNWDWDPLLSDAPVILRSYPTNQAAIVTLVEAGMIGKIGFNQYGLGVCLNFLSHSTDGEPGVIGVPIHCLLRAVMNCTTIDEAVATVSAAPRCASANFLIAQHGSGDPRSLDLEISPLKVAAISDQKAGLVHTNHFLDPELAVGCTSGRGPSTMMRFEEATELVVALEAVEPDPVIRAQRVLESRANLPYPISRHQNPDPSSSTLAGIIMDLTSNRFIVASGAPHRSTWTELPGV
jgi:isopenicillin-N N-acyltransferase-like protein